MPIRRLGLLDEVVDDTTLVAAWVDVPTLRVVPSTQRYSSATHGRVTYRSIDGSFESELVVDDDGVVVDYPSLARRVPV